MSMIHTLERYRALTREAMAEALAGGSPTDYLYDLVRDYAARDGKGLRPGLLLVAADACGTSLRTALPAAAALELLHTAFLIHDDVEDGSRLRRGRPTLHELHGVALAVNAGDALANLATQPLMSSAFPRYRSREVLAELRMAIRQTTEGQALELGWRRHGVVDLTVVDYLELVGRKTCWYTTMAPLRIAAQLGRWRPRPTALDRLGFLAGCAFQIRDDLLDLAPGGQLGKEPRSDLREGKRTLMLIHLLGHAAAAERRWIVDYLTRGEGERTAAEADRLLDQMIDAGSLAYAERVAGVLATEAQRSLAVAFADVPDSDGLEVLRELVDYLVDRRE
ncbi:MAG TPA: polyprenyl synthetase family protein [Microlunatus sp.]|nr:polyprenyl synthetase family protein [Microlunatus sp.]